MNKKVRRELIEWGLFIVIVGGLYLSGWHTEVLGTLQRGILATGLFQPGTEEEAANTASYDLELIDVNGNTLQLEEWKGKPIFINFWATWCPPCIAEMPDIHGLYEQMGDEVMFALISLDDDPEKARQFIERKEYEFPVYFLKSGVPAEYSSSSIPSTFVISSDGKIVVDQRGMAKYNTSSFREFLQSI